MSIESHTCSRCGGGLMIGQATCPYCGATVRPPQVKPVQPAKPVSPPPAASPPSPGVDNLPPELASLQAPKPVQPIDSSGCLLVFGLIWTVFSALFLIVGVTMYLRDSISYNRLSSQGIPVAAAITDLEIRSGDDSDSYYVHYQFQAPIKGDPVRFQGSDEVGGSVYSRLEVGQSIGIVYWPEDPSLSAIKAELKPAQITLLLCLGSIGALFTVIGLALMSASISGIMNANQLRVSGRDASGIVFKKWTDRDSDGDTTYFVAYAFRAETPGGGLQLIPRAEQNKKIYQRCQVGDKVPVRYLPSAPNICQVKY